MDKAFSKNTKKTSNLEKDLIN